MIKSDDINTGYNVYEKVKWLVILKLKRVSIIISVKQNKTVMDRCRLNRKIEA